MTHNFDNMIFERLYEWTNRGKAPPLKATLIITERCELRCIFCRNFFKTKNLESYKNEFTKKEWIDVVKEGVRFGIKEWAITGGEPFVKSDVVISLVQTIKKEDASAVINITTNGYSLMPDTANNLVKLGCNRIEIGIDAPDAGTHNFLRGNKNSYKKATDSVKYLARAKNKFEKENPTIIIKTILNSKNYDKLTDMIKLAHHSGANTLEIIPLRIYEQNRELIEKNKLVLNKKEKKEMNKSWTEIENTSRRCGVRVDKSFIDGVEDLSKIINYKNKSGQLYESSEHIFEFSNPTSDITENSSKTITNKNQRKNENWFSKDEFLSAFCYTPFYSLLIDPNGNISPCSSIPTSEFEGYPSLNLRETRLEDIWYGEFFNFLRNLSIEGKPINDKCKSCGTAQERKRILDGITKSKGD